MSTGCSPGPPPGPLPGPSTLPARNARIPRGSRSTWTRAESKPSDARDRNVGVHPFDRSRISRSRAVVGPRATLAGRSVRSRRRVTSAAQDDARRRAPGGPRSHEGILPCLAPSPGSPSPAASPRCSAASWPSRPARPPRTPQARRQQARPADLRGRPAPVRPRLVRRSSTRTRRWRGWSAAASTTPTPAPRCRRTPSPAWSPRSPAATPGTTGVYYDDTYNHALLPAGTTNCAGAKPGAEVDLTEALDKNQNSIDAGQGLAGLPGSILSHDRPTPQTLIDPAHAAGRPGDLQAGLPALVPQGEHGLRGGAPGRPADRLVGQARGLRDPQRPVRHRHPGPVHAGDQQPGARLPGRAATGPRTTPPPSSTTATRCRRSSTRSTATTTAGTRKVGTPAIFGMNFQTVSTAAEAARRPTAWPAATSPTASRPARCCRARWTTSTPRSARSSRELQAKGHLADSTSHPVRQARPVADRPGRADPDRRRPAASTA